MIEKPYTIDDHLTLTPIMRALDEPTPSFLAGGGKGLIDLIALINAGSAVVDVREAAFQNVNYVSGSSGGIDFNEPGRIQVSTHFDPPDAGTKNMGGSERYWGYINTYEISKQGGGGFGVFDTGVTLQDGRVVSDVTALKQMRPHATRVTDYGKPIYDMSTIPKEVLVLPKTRDGKPLKKDKDGRYIERTKKGELIEHTEGERVFAMISILIGAVRELSDEIDNLKTKTSV